MRYEFNFGPLLYNNFLFFPKNDFLSFMLLRRILYNGWYILYLILFFLDFSQVKYIVKPELLPSYIPSDVAAKILFVGEYVSVLDSTDNSDTCKYNQNTIEWILIASIYKYF